METDTRPLGEAERLDWLRLTRTDQVGPVTFRALLERFGTAAKALEALPELSRRGGRTRPIQPPSRAQAEREVKALAKRGGRFIAACEPDYPPLLAAIEDAPPILAVIGAVPILASPAVGIVGSRNASTNGRGLAEAWARELGSAGLTIVSGLARGIDAAAHQGSLVTGTVACMAGGLDQVYPPEHGELARQIARDGALISEVPLGVAPGARHFPRRNRLISGLSLAVLVIEANARSGALITARMAGEHGREVMAVPGSPLDPRSQGANRLIKDGAHLVEHPDDVIAVLRQLETGVRERVIPVYREDQTMPMVDEATLRQARVAVLEALSVTPTPVDDLIRHCQLSAPAVRTVVLELELAGRIERQAGDRIALIA